jgi:hypothetical protein
LSLTLETAPDTHPCRFDPEKLEKIISNLLSNALKCTPAGGQVTVQLDVTSPAEGDASPTAVLEVKDNGAGIPPEKQDEVFDRFAHGQSADHEESGTGIGLSLAYELAQLHGGTITLNSTPGEGSTFAVHLPLPLADPDTIESPAPDNQSSLSLGTASHTTAGNGQASAGDPSAKRTSADEDTPMILVAEDNADVRAYLQRHLDGQSTVVTANNGAEALETARRT